MLCITWWLSLSQSVIESTAYRKYSITDVFFIYFFFGGGLIGVKRNCDFMEGKQFPFSQCHKSAMHRAAAVYPCPIWTGSVASLRVPLIRPARFSVWGIPTDINMILQWQLIIRLFFSHCTHWCSVISPLFASSLGSDSGSMLCYILTLICLEIDKNMAAWDGCGFFFLWFAFVTSQRANL